MRKGYRNPVSVMHQTMEGQSYTRKTSRTMKGHHIITHTCYVYTRKRKKSRCKYEADMKSSQILSWLSEVEKGDARGKYKDPASRSMSNTVGNQADILLLKRSDPEKPISNIQSFVQHTIWEPSQPTFCHANLLRRN
jgi:hypothetical protein